MPSMYTGWQQVENAAVALSETANLIMIPGRLCENGLPVPIVGCDVPERREGARRRRVQALEAAQVQEHRQDGRRQRHGLRRLRGLSRELPRQVPQGKMRCVPN